MSGMPIVAIVAGMVLLFAMTAVIAVTMRSVRFTAMLVTVTAMPVPVTVAFPLFRLHQKHAAFWALARCVADDLGVHRAGICPRPARVLGVARMCVIGGV